MSKVSIRSGWKSEKLTLSERDSMTIGPSITTTTFVRGTLKVGQAALQARLHLITTANPWLRGRLVKRGSDLYLDYPTIVGQNDGHVEGSFIEDGRGGNCASVNSAMDYAGVCGGVAKTRSEVGNGGATVNKDKPLIVLSVVADNARSDTFVVVLSISHVILDGFNYYQILNMLSEGTEIKTLSCARKHEIETQTAHALGEEDFKWMKSTGIICNVVSNMFCGSQAIVRCFAIDDVKVNQEKEKAARNANGGFVSTNDVITSSFGNACSTQHLLMPINFRNKLPDFNDGDAGNYEGALLFAGSGEFGSPADIRNTLKSGPPKFLRGANASGLAPNGGPVPLPVGCWGATKTRLGMVTNWAFGSFDELKIAGCEQMVHLPHADCKMIPFDIAVIFRPKAGKTAVTYFVRNVDEAGLKAECPVAGMVTSAEDYHKEIEAVHAPAPVG